MTRYSILDLAYVTQDASFADTFEKSVSFARYAESLGYTRYWFAEHHNMESVASSATPILIGHIAEKTKTIRVGSGGIMLPNHSPLVIAETFGTLATLYPNRIDLGLGRAPGTDQQTAHLIRPDFLKNSQEFPENVRMLQRFLSKENKKSPVRAFPAEDTDVSLYILGSSTESAHLAAAYGLPYAFASHFAPAQMTQAFQFYENEFRADVIHQPYKMAAANIIVADSISEAQKIATSFYQMFLGIIRNDRRPMQPPVKSMDNIWNVNEEAYVRQMTSFSFIGDKEGVRKSLKYSIEKYNLDEIIVSTPIFYEEDRMKSMKYLAEIMSELKSCK